MPTEIQAITVTLDVDGEQSLFIMLSSDGGITRKGNGSVDKIERRMFIGKEDLQFFERVRSWLTPPLMEWFGQRLEAPQRRGKVCDLCIFLTQIDGRESSTQWRYGSDSVGPHPNVVEFVLALVSATDKWLEKQPGARAGSRPRV